MQNQNSLDLLGLAKAPPKKFKYAYADSAINRNRKGIQYWKDYRKCLYNFEWTIIRLSFVNTWNDEDEADVNLELLEWYYEGATNLDEDGESIQHKNIAICYRIVNCLHLVLQLNLSTSLRYRLHMLRSKVNDRFKYLEKNSGNFDAAETTEDFVEIDNFYSLPRKEKHLIFATLRSCDDKDEMLNYLKQLKVMVNDF